MHFCMKKPSVISQNYNIVIKYCIKIRNVYHSTVEFTILIDLKVYLHSLFLLIYPTCNAYPVH